MPLTPVEPDHAADDRHAGDATGSGRVSSKLTRATFARRGLSVPVACTGAMDGSAKLTVSSADAKRLKLSRARRSTAADVRVLGPAHGQGDAQAVLGARQARSPRKGGPKSVKLTLSVQMRDWGKPPTTTKKTITLNR